MSWIARLADALDARLGLRAPWRRALGRLFPSHWSFLLGEVTLFSLAALVVSGTYLALFYRPSIAPVVYRGAYAPFAGRSLPEAFESVLVLSLHVPFGLVVRRFHHFAAHLFVGSLLLHAARVYFSGAFRRPRELTWWIGLALFALALVNGYTGYCLPFDMRGGTAMRMMMTTLESVPWCGGWLATLAFGAPFPGPYILGRLYIEHVFVGPALIAALVAAHLVLVVRLTHTDYPGPGRSSRSEVGGRLWPEQTARATTLALIVFGTIALLSAFFPVEAVQVYGPFQSFSSYEPLLPDWFLMWIEGAYRLLPGALDVHLVGASFTNPFYGAVLLPLLVFGGCAAYPWLDARVYGEQLRGEHVLDRARERPLRTAFGLSGIVFLVLVSLGAVDDRIARAARTTVDRVDVVLDVLAPALPPLVLAAVLLHLRARRARGDRRGRRGLRRAATPAAR
jgi:ubiquinol-cytochrome c reductase cytochrome b subunit